MKHTMLIDTSALLHRAKHAVGDKLSHKDIETGLMFGFFIQIFKLANKFKTNRFIFALDGGGGSQSIRHRIYPDYKKSRIEKSESDKKFDKYCYTKFDEVISYLRAMGFKNIHSAPGFEADDIIASFLLYNIDLQKNSVIVSSDNDFYQLLNMCKGMFLASKNKLYTKYDLEDEYGITPEQWKKVKEIAGCFDEKTEILTDSGWKKFKNLLESDKVFSMNPTTQIAEYCKIDNFISYQYSGDMYKVKGRGIDALVTPNHSFFGDTTQSYLKKGKVKFKEIQDIVKYKNFTIPITVNGFVGGDREFVNIPDVLRKFTGGNGCKVEKVLKGFNIKTSVFMAFLGIYLADGYTTKNRNGKIGKVGICKCKPKKMRIIRRVLDMMGIHYKYEDSSNTFIINNVPLAEFLHPMGNAYTKRIPQEFKNMSTQYLKILWSYMVLCDGTMRMGSYDKKGKKYNRRAYFTVNPNLAKDFQEIVIKSGKQCSIKSRPPRKWNIKGKSGWSRKQYTAYVKKTKYVNICEEGVEISVVPFDGTVYDIETRKYHTILVRRNKIVYWSSNCKGDGVPGIPGVGYPTAAKFLTGELVKGKVYDRIISPDFDNVKKLAKKLTWLPIAKTPKIKFVDDQYDLNFDVFLELCTTMSFNSFISNGENFNCWKRFFEGNYGKK